MSLAWLAHLYTATGVLLAFYAAEMTFTGGFDRAFLALALAVVIDGTDGWLARALADLHPPGRGLLGPAHPDGGARGGQAGTGAGADASGARGRVARARLDCVILK